MAESDERLLVVSPHYDDAVFSCGELMAACGDAVVVTVFSGAPADTSLCTDWDRHCGFSLSVEAMAERQRENEVALERLGAASCDLGFLDSQYGQTPEVSLLARSIASAIDAHRATRVVMPLGLWHSDHVLTGAACIAVYRQMRNLRWVAYEDALYRRMPGEVQRRLIGLYSEAVGATPAFPFAQCVQPPNEGHESPRWRQQKRSAIGAYVSQLKAFGRDGYGDTDQPEHYWHLGDASEEKI